MFKLDLFDIEQDLITSTSIEGDTLDSIRENLTLAIKSVEGENPYTCVLIAKATEESQSWKVGGSTGILDDFIESNFMVLSLTISICHTLTLLPRMNTRNCLSMLTYAIILKLLML